VQAMGNMAVAVREAGIDLLSALRPQGLRTQRRGCAVRAPPSAHPACTSFARRRTRTRNALGNSQCSGDRGRGKSIGDRHARARIESPSRRSSSRSTSGAYCLAARRRVLERPSAASFAEQSPSLVRARRSGRLAARDSRDLPCRPAPPALRRASSPAT
jgi:hypothetical protein